MHGEFVRVDRDGPVATIRLDRPPVNALNLSVSLELQRAAEAVAADPEIRAVVLWGGERIFAAGADVAEMVDQGPEEVEPQVAALERACRDLEAVPKPVIAAISRYALGGGYELALACDVRIAGADAKVGLPEIRLGIIPGAGGTQRLPRLVGFRVAWDLISSGRHVAAEEALRLGLVDRVVAPADVYPVAMEEARSWARGPTRALGAAKAALLAAHDLGPGLAAERREFLALFDSEDKAEGMRAFLDKREPRFEGR